MDVTFSSRETLLRPNRFLWVFGDGDTSVQDFPTHTYLRGGTSFVQLFLYDRDITPITDGSIPLDHPSFLSFSLPLFTTISVGYFGSTAPQRELSIVPSSRCSASNTVSFAGTEAEHGLPPYYYHWDFGDGFTSTDPNPSHIFARPGVYNVSLTVDDSYGDRLGWWLGGKNNEWHTSRLFPIGMDSGPSVVFDWSAPVRYWWNLDYNGTMDANPSAWTLFFDTSESCVTPAITDPNDPTPLTLGPSPSMMGQKFFLPMG